MSIASFVYSLVEFTFETWNRSQIEWNSFGKFSIDRRINSFNTNDQTKRKSFVGKDRCRTNLVFHFCFASFTVERSSITGRCDHSWRWNYSSNGSIEEISFVKNSLFIRVDTKWKIFESIILIQTESNDENQFEFIEFRAFRSNDQRWNNSGSFGTMARWFSFVFIRQREKVRPLKIDCRILFFNFSAILFDPRTTLVTPEFRRRCENRKVQLLTIDFDSYLTRILSPICSLWDKKWSEANRIDKMFLRSPFDLRRIVHSFWFSLRMLKENEEIQKLFRESPFWRRNDENFLQSLKTNVGNRTNSPKKRKKKLLVKTGAAWKILLHRWISFLRFRQQR